MPVKLHNLESSGGEWLREWENGRTSGGRSETHEQDVEWVEMQIFFS